jgi:hypothetical protein
MHKPHSTPQKHFSASGTHFYQKLSKSQGLGQLEGIGKLKKFIHLIRSQTRDLPVRIKVSISGALTDKTQ